MNKMTIDDIAKDVAKRALEDLEVNDMPLTEFLVKVDRVADFLKSEIRICEERLNKSPSPYYDGVDVGFGKSAKLDIKHIQFCKKILEMMNFEE